MDCFNKTVRLQVLEDSVEIVVEKKSMSTRVTSALRPNRLIRGEHEGYLAFITKDKLSKAVEIIPVVCEFLDVFPNRVYATDDTDIESTLPHSSSGVKGLKA